MILILYTNANVKKKSIYLLLYLFILMFTSYIIISSIIISISAFVDWTMGVKLRDKVKFLSLTTLLLL